MRGTIEKLNESFGFIRGDDTVSYFIMPSLLIEGLFWEDLREGNWVEFSPTNHPKGPRAIKVALVGAGRRGKDGY